MAGRNNAISTQESPEPSGTRYEQAEFSWTVSNIDVGEHCVVIFMSADGTEFHRANGFDQRVYFAYVVRPPLGH
jgi:hypothetical protein